MCTIMDPTPRPPPTTAELEQKRQALEADAVGAASGEVFSAYTPTHNLGGVDHPADIAEAASLAATPSPVHTYPLIDAISRELIDKGILSSLQLESISLACQRHLTILPTTPLTRAAFFLGDGAGVGKGRQLAGMIYDNLARGRPRQLWFSSSSDLRVDAQRDLQDVGVHGCQVIDGCQGLDRSACKGLGMSKDMQAGVLFSTYATLVSVTAGQKAKGNSRLQQLVEWCGGPAFVSNGGAGKGAVSATWLMAESTRMIGLRIEGQWLLFDAFVAQLEEIVWAARRDGKYDEGITDVAGSSVSLEQAETQLWTDPVTRAQTRCALVQIDRGVS